MKNCTWEEYMPGISFKLAGLDSVLYQAALLQAQREAGEKGITEQEELDIQCRLLGLYVVLDWTGGVHGADGLPVDYSPGAAEALLKQNVDVFCWVVDKAKRASTAH